MPWPGESYKDKAMRIIASNMYMVLATSNKKTKPWANVVLFVFDGKKNFYFISAIDSLHAKNIDENPWVAFTIFDSAQPIGSTDAIQGSGTASLVGKDEIKKAIDLYAPKVFPDSTIPPAKRYPSEQYLGASEFRFFKIAVDELFVTGEDRREEIEL